MSIGLSVEEVFCNMLFFLYGFYVIGLFDVENLNMIYVVKNKSLLLVGVGDNFNVVVSDVMVML